MPIRQKLREKGHIKKISNKYLDINKYSARDLFWFELNSLRYYLYFVIKERKS